MELGEFHHRLVLVVEIEAQVMHRRPSIDVSEDPCYLLDPDASPMHHSAAGSSEVVVREVESHSFPKLVQNLLDGAFLAGVEVAIPLIGSAIERM